MTHLTGMMNTNKILRALLGFAIMNMGIAFSIKGALGTSPISSVPYVVSEITGYTVGTVAIVFGMLTDLAIWVIRGIVVHNYAEQWLCCLQRMRRWIDRAS